MVLNPNAKKNFTIENVKTLMLIAESLLTHKMVTVLM